MGLDIHCTVSLGVLVPYKNLYDKTLVGAAAHEIFTGHKNIENSSFCSTCGTPLTSPRNIYHTYKPCVDCSDGTSSPKIGPYDGIVPPSSNEYVIISLCRATTQSNRRGYYTTDISFVKLDQTNAHTKEELFKFLTENNIDFDPNNFGYWAINTSG